MQLPSSLVPEMKQQMRSARLVWQFDEQTLTPLMLLFRLARKYPEYEFSWSWAWLFPAHYPCRDPRSGRLVRYRMHEGNVQRAVKYHAANPASLFCRTNCVTDINLFEAN